MAIEYFDGFETGGTGDWVISGGSSGVLIAAVDARTGALGMGNSATTGTAGAVLALPATAKKTVGFAYRALPGALTLGTPTLLNLMSDNAGTTHLSLGLIGTGQCRLLLGTTASGTQLGVGAPVVANSAWHYFEVQATIADSGGRCTVRVDGVVVIDYTGDTRNAGTSTNIDAIRLAAGQTNTNTQSWDDFYVLNGTDDTAVTGRPDNDFLGDVRVESLLPNGDGAVSAWTPSTGTSHSGVVDEAPPNTSDWLSAATLGAQDLWTLSDLSAPTVQVYGMRPSFYASKTDAGATGLKGVIRESGGTVTVDSTATPLTTTYLPVSATMRKTKPAGGAWSVADVNGLQIGVEKA